MTIDFNRVKIVVTVPLENTDEVRDAMCKAGAGVIGNYTNCSMLTKCTGTFKPNDYANPYIGQNNNLEFVSEDKVEVVCDSEKVRDVLKALRSVHPYEEPAIDIIPLVDEDCFK